MDATQDATVNPGRAVPRSLSPTSAIELAAATVKRSNYPGFDQALCESGAEVAGRQIDAGTDFGLDVDAYSSDAQLITWRDEAIAERKKREPAIDEAIGPVREAHRAVGSVPEPLPRGAVVGIFVAVIVITAIFVLAGREIFAISLDTSVVRPYESELVGAQAAKELGPDRALHIATVVVGALFFGMAGAVLVKYGKVSRLMKAGMLACDVLLAASVALLRASEVESVVALAGWSAAELSITCAHFVFLWAVSNRLRADGEVREQMKKAQAAFNAATAVLAFDEGLLAEARKTEVHRHNDVARREDAGRRRDAIKATAEATARHEYAVGSAERVAAFSGNLAAGQGHGEVEAMIKQKHDRLIDAISRNPGGETRHAAV